MKPEIALHNWAVPSLENIDPSIIKRATSGLLNQTFLIRPGGEPEVGGELFVLQLVHPAVSMDGAMNNYFHVTQFLHEQGMPTQTMLKTSEGNLWVEDDEKSSWRWRLLRGVEGVSFEKATGPAMAEQGGETLGTLHTILKNYSEQLEIGRISHRYEGEIEKLEKFMPILLDDEDNQVREAAKMIHELLPQLILPKDIPTQIIHADPKISNFLFNSEDKAICMIDFDTLQVLPPIIDIGDAIRSWCGQEEDNPNNTFNTEIYNALLKGYFANSKSLLSAREQSLVPQAAQLLMIGLACRFLNDYVEDSYFGWDETKYDSRKAHNKARVMGQLSLYQTMIKSI